MSKVNVPLSGVKTTLKRVAEKLEFDMQVLKLFDSNMRMAETSGRQTARRSDRGDIMSERRMIVIVG